jgi:SAM-dependent methyltransferase
MVGANEEQRAYWNREEARHWVDEQRQYDDMLGPFGDAMLDAADIQPSHRVLDVGCGNGATTREAARRAKDGAALGLDLSQLMVERARETAREEGVDNVSFEVGDVQTRDFDVEFDRAISRFGVMFFDDPVAAFANIGRALRDGGRVAFVVWQEFLSNEWITIPAMAALQHMPIPDLGEPGAPGPFALGDPDRIRNIFTEAGYQDLEIEPFETSLLIGGRGTLETAVDFISRTSFGQGIQKHTSSSSTSNVASPSIGSSPFTQTRARSSTAVNSVP